MPDLRTLLELGVDIVQNHNMRLLAGAETNSQETRDRFKFRTRYRLIHGDAGIYKTPSGVALKAFEYEESLRSTDTMSEADLFYLRKLHFLVDFCWNIEVYKPLLSLGLLYDVNPIDVLTRLLDSIEDGEHKELSAFFADFHRKSETEWFDSEQDILDYFADEANFNRLLNQEFEKLNIQYSVIALRDYKAAFDRAIGNVLARADAVPADVLAEAAKVTFALFPPLEDEPDEKPIEIPSNLLALDEATIETFAPAADKKTIYLKETKARQHMRKTISSARGTTLSKILNTQGFSLRDLKLASTDSYRFDQAFRRMI